MTEEKDLNASEFATLLQKHEESSHVPQVGEIIKGIVVSASKAEVRLDIDGTFIGVVRGRELYDESPEYSSLKPGDEIEATVVDGENELGNIELSFRYAGQEKAWAALRDSFENKTNIKARIVDANRGGLLCSFGQIAGFLPVSQLAPENYPRVSGGDKTRILEKLKSFVGQEFEVRVMNLDEKGDKIIFSEKEAWSEKQRDVIAKYKVGSRVKGRITAVTDFGVFLSFGDNLEGLIHISELAWQRIDDPADLFKVGQDIEAEVINIDGSKIFLSAKKLARDPWADISKKFKVDQVVKCEILKVNPFGLFVKLDEEIHGLAHMSQLGIEAGKKVEELYKSGEQVELRIISIEPKEHRLGLAALHVKVDEKKEADEKAVRAKKAVKKETPAVEAVADQEAKEEIVAEKTAETEI